MGIFQNLPHPVIYFSRCRNIAVYDENNCFCGKLCDLFVDYGEGYPSVLAILIKHNAKFKCLEWKEVKLFSYAKIVIANVARMREGKQFFRMSRPGGGKNLLQVSRPVKKINCPGLARAIVDRQIVDISGKKVVRVNDIHLIKMGGVLRVTHAAIGAKSMARRLGLEGTFMVLLRVVSMNTQKELNEKIIDWKFVHPVADQHLADVKLNVTNEDLDSLHPADLADIIEELSGYGQQEIFQALDKERAADTLAEIEQEDLQANLLERETPEDAAKIIEYMGTDEAADVLGEMRPEKVENIIAKIQDQEVKDDIQELLRYGEDTAGGLMSTDILVVDRNRRKNEMLNILEDRHEEYENIYDIFITDSSERLIGTCSLRKLITSRGNIKIGDIMTTNDMKYQAHDVHWKKLAKFMSKYNLINIPIVDHDRKVLGFVSVDDILPWLLDER